MYSFYKIKNVSHVSSGNVFGLRYPFTNCSIKYMMRKKKPALRTASSPVNVPTESLWQKVSFSEGSDFNYLGARNSHWRFFGGKESISDYSFIFRVYGCVVDFSGVPLKSVAFELYSKSKLGDFLWNISWTKKGTSGVFSSHLWSKNI